MHVSLSITRLTKLFGRRLESLSRDKSMAKHLSTRVSRRSHDTFDPDLETSTHMEKDSAVLHNSSKKSSRTRLEEMRKKLESDSPVLTKFKSSTKREKKGAPAPLKTSTISWKDILESARENYADDLEMKPSPDMLTDTFSRTHSYLRISLAERCNLRCLYCMPPEGVPLQAQEKLMNANEIDRLVKLFTAGGVNKVS